ncbi:MAG: hypothetical protein JWL59_307 [Chthoniobacteraceae bacterium]|nr:hypothetical protein [Chthoniobacteraceae bacterium]
MMYLKKLVPNFIAKRFFPAHFEQNLETLKKLLTHSRDPHIPPASAMAELLNLIDARDAELGSLIRGFAYSGVRKSALLGKKGLTWERVDFSDNTITFLEKGARRGKGADGSEAPRPHAEAARAINPLRLGLPHWFVP